MPRRIECRHVARSAECRFTPQARSIIFPTRLINDRNNMTKPDGRTPPLGGGEPLPGPSTTPTRGIGMSGRVGRGRGGVRFEKGGTSIIINDQGVMPKGASQVKNDQKVNKWIK